MRCDGGTSWSVASSPPCRTGCACRSARRRKCSGSLPPSGSSSRPAEPTPPEALSRLNPRRLEEENAGVPELPDIVVYVEALERRIKGRPLEAVRLASPFLLRSVDPPPAAAHRRIVRGLRRIGKRIAFELEGDLFLVLHLMISGRLRWRERGAKIPGRLGLAAFDFPGGTLLLTEAGSKKRASLHVVRGEDGLEAFGRGELEVLEA